VGNTRTGAYGKGRQTEVAVGTNTDVHGRLWWVVTAVARWQG